MERVARAGSLFKPADPEAAWQALSRFNLGDKLYSRVDRLSGGERQRCGLARLLLSPAKALLVDEPLSALDPALSELTLTTLREEAKARNATLICSLHQVELALSHFRASSPCAMAASLSTCRASGHAADDRRAVSGRTACRQPGASDDQMAVKLGVGACL
jgi:phosphonate transport system ATP-binding protein